MAEERAGTISVIAILEVVWRYRLLVGICGFGLAAFAVWLSFKTEFVYSSEVVVTPVIQSETNGLGGLATQFGGLASLAGINLAGSGAGQESLAVLKSRYLAEKFISSEKLVPAILRNARKQSLWLAVDEFRRSLVNIRQDKDSGTIIVTVQWRNAEESARWANTYVALANDILRARALEDSGRNIRFLNEQISKTPVVEVQRVMYALIENETKKQMLASTRMQYAFAVVDPAVTPEERIWPRRTIMVLTGGVLGGMLGVLLALGHNTWRQYRKKPGA
jgi:uncharacterized protein involved in exopolysaccharide biosynthesis